MSILEIKDTIRVKCREYLNKKFSRFRIKKIIDPSFSIISNNCWGGHVYRFFGNKAYSSPTVGLYIWAEDYILLLSDLRNFFEQDLKFININESKYKDELIRKNQQNIPIGVLEYSGKRVEIVFLHYKSREEAYEKWMRRVKRVNYDNLIVKNSYMNLCKDDYVADFEKLPFPKKVFFVPRKMDQYSSTVYFPGYEKDLEIKNDTLNFRKYINLFSFINYGTYK